MIEAFENIIKEIVRKRVLQNTWCSDLKFSKESNFVVRFLFVSLFFQLPEVPPPGVNVNCITSIKYSGGTH